MGPDDKQGQRSDQSAAKQPQQGQELDKSPQQADDPAQGQKHQADADKGRSGQSS